MSALLRRVPAALRTERAAAIAGYGTIAIAAAVLGYFSLFSQFRIYDDSGHLSVSLTEFMHGRTLYDDLYSQYGPLYFLLFGGLFSLPAVDLTTDSVRIVALLFWIASAVGLGLITERFTGARRMGLLCSLTAVAGFAFLAPEPMHPLGITTFLVVLILAAIAWAPERWHGRGPLILGALIGALAMIKINMGALAAVAVLASALLALTPARHRRLAQAGAAILVTVAIGTLLSTGLGDEWVQRTLVLSLGAVLAIVVRATTLRPFGADAPAFGAWIARVAAGALAVVLTIVVLIGLLGTSPAQFIDGVLIDPTRHPGIDEGILILPQEITDWVLIALAAAIVATLLAGRGARATLGSLGAAGRIIAALAIYYTVLGISPVTIAPGSGEVALPMLLAWLAAVAPAEFRESPARAFARLLVVMVATLEVLQAYPAAGSQRLAAAAPFLLVGTLLLHDGLLLVALRTRKRERSQRHAITIALSAGVLVFAVHVAIAGIAKPIKENAGTWRNNESLTLPGAKLLRLPPTQAAAYREIVAAVKHNRCDPVVTLPGMYSFHGWFGDRPPTGYNVSDWMLLVNEERQNEMVRAVADKPRMCVLSNDETQRFYDAISDPPGEPQPFLDYLRTTPLRTVLDVSDGLPRPFFEKQNSRYTLQVRR